MPYQARVSVTTPVGAFQGQLSPVGSYESAEMENARVAQYLMSFESGTFTFYTLEDVQVVIPHALFKKSVFALSIVEV
jgi:hypothetical protein